MIKRSVLRDIPGKVVKSKDIPGEIGLGRYQLRNIRAEEVRSRNTIGNYQHMTIKKSVKTGIRMIIEADGNFTTLIIRASKSQLIGFLDKILPDDEK